MSKKRKNKASSGKTRKKGSLKKDKENETADSGIEGWKKRSIFFDLSYWKDLYVRHCLDVMHIEKSICDSLISTLLNVLGKTKDSIMARKDYEVLLIRLELAPQVRGKRTFLPPTCYTLSKQEKFQRDFLQILAVLCLRKT